MRTIRLTNAPEKIAINEEGVGHADGAEMYADGMEKVSANDKKNMNCLYKQYVKWHHANPDGKPALSFKEWLRWAQKKGIANNPNFQKEMSEVKQPKYRTDGDKNETTVADDKTVTDPLAPRPNIDALALKKKHKKIMGMVIGAAFGILLIGAAGSSK